MAFDDLMTLTDMPLIREISYKKLITIFLFVIPLQDCTARLHEELHKRLFRTQFLYRTFIPWNSAPSPGHTLHKKRLVRLHFRASNKSNHEYRSRLAAFGREAVAVQARADARSSVADLLL
jgi:hypothetical protein